MLLKYRTHNITGVGRGREEEVVFSLHGPLSSDFQWFFKGNGSTGTVILVWVTMLFALLDGLWEFSCKPNEINFHLEKNKITTIQKVDKWRDAYSLSWLDGLGWHLSWKWRIK